MDNAKKMLIMRHGFKSITFSAYKERLLKLFRMAADRPQLVDGRWYNQQIQYTQNDVSIIIISSRITVSKPLNKSCEEDNPYAEPPESRLTCTSSQRSCDLCYLIYGRQVYIVKRL